MAPENLAAIRGLAEIHQRCGQLSEALAQFRRALTLAPHDPDLEETVSRLAAGLEASPAPSPAPEPAPVAPPAEAPVPADVPAPANVMASAEAPAPVNVMAPAEAPVPADVLASAEAPAPADVPVGSTPASRQVETLERWLDAILADRERRV